MKKKTITVLLGMAVLLSLAACGKKQDAGAPPAGTVSDDNLDYTYGEHFKSDTPVSYTMMFSDNEGYPYNDKWMIFNEIAKESNVTLDFKDYMIARPDYDQKKALIINGGQAPYIIPKVYDDSLFVSGGAIVPISEWTQFMPNYTSFVEKYNLGPDIDTIRQQDGKYYRLPGLHEMALQDYTLLVRDDIFKAAGYDVSTMEKDWTWQDLYDVLVGVKSYMVKEGLCGENDYIWSERWPGDDGSGGNLLKLMGSSYGVPAGWDISAKNAMVYDRDSDKWLFAPTTDEYKEFVTMLNKFIAGGILDPESFTQTDEQAVQKFYSGKTVIIATSRSVQSEYRKKMDSTLGAGNYSLYMVVYPMGTVPYNAENVRLENGIMFSENALKDLGDDGFIKMLRFVDWLWYSPEGKDLTKWGVKGLTYNIVKDETTGKEIKRVTDQYYGNGKDKDSDSEELLSAATGFGGGVFAYGGTLDEVTDSFSAEVQDYSQRNKEYRKIKPLDPNVPFTEDEKEQLNLIKTPLIDNVNSWTLRLAVGQQNIGTDWDKFVKSCDDLNAQQLVDLTNEAYAQTKEKAE